MNPHVWQPTSRHESEQPPAKLKSVLPKLPRIFMIAPHPKSQCCIPDAGNFELSQGLQGQGSTLKFGGGAKEAPGEKLILISQGVVRFHDALLRVSRSHCSTCAATDSVSSLAQGMGGGAGAEECRDVRHLEPGESPRYRDHTGAGALVLTPLDLEIYCL